jgi:hypothetical protein
MMRVPLFHNIIFMVLSPFVILVANFLVNLGTHSMWGDSLAIVYFSLYGIYCVQNYLHCHEYHCLVTGPGFCLAGILMVLRDAELFDHGFGVPFVVFFASAVVGHAFEWKYFKHTGTRFRTKESRFS